MELNKLDAHRHRQAYARSSTCVVVGISSVHRGDQVGWCFVFCCSLSKQPLRQTARGPFAPEEDDVAGPRCQAKFICKSWHEFDEPNVEKRALHRTSQRHSYTTHVASRGLKPTMILCLVGREACTSPRKELSCVMLFSIISRNLTHPTSMWGRQGPKAVWVQSLCCSAVATSCLQSSVRWPTACPVCQTSHLC